MIGSGHYDESMQNIYLKYSSFKSCSENFSKYQSSNFLRFSLQAYLQSLLLSRRVVGKSDSVYKCHRNVWASVFSITRNPKTFKAYYDAVVTCHNAKSCPVCAPRIMGVRSAEIKKAVHEWLNKDKENTCYMLTVTFAHCVTDQLQDLLSSFKIALNLFWGNGSVKRMFNAAGRVGRITATEIQYSRKNGFHPHQHILIFCKKNSFDIELLRSFWLSSLRAAGLNGLSSIALNLIEARSVENYLTKISSEMTLGHLKDGRGDGESFSPLQIAYAAFTGESWAADVFCEYYKAVRGQHFLCWSRGLKSYFGINDVSDEDISLGASDPDLQHFIDVLGEDFKKLNWSDKAALQNYAAVDDFVSASALLSRLNVQHWKEYRED